VAAGGLAVAQRRKSVSVAVAAAVEEAGALAGLLVEVPAGLGAQAGTRLHGLLAYGMALRADTGLVHTKM